MRKRGIDVKKMIDEGVERELLARRIRAAIHKRLDNEVFQYDLEWKISAALKASLALIKARKSGAAPAVDYRGASAETIASAKRALAVAAARRVGQR